MNPYLFSVVCAHPYACSSDSDESVGHAEDLGGLLTPFHLFLNPRVLFCKVISSGILIMIKKGCVPHRHLENRLGQVAEERAMVACTTSWLNP